MTPNQFGKAHRHFRKRARLSQEGVMILLNKPNDRPQRISQWERGMSMPYLREFPLICYTIETTPDEFITYALEQEE